MTQPSPIFYLSIALLVPFFFLGCDNALKAPTAHIPINSESKPDFTIKNPRSTILEYYGNSQMPLSRQTMENRIQNWRGFQLIQDEWIDTYVHKSVGIWGEKDPERLLYLEKTFFLIKTHIQKNFDVLSILQEQKREDGNDYEQTSRDCLTHLTQWWEKDKEYTHTFDQCIPTIRRYNLAQQVHEYKQTL